jgi:hypothetical protein
MDAHKNFAVSAVATAPSPATSGTSLVVTAGHGTRFPAVPFNATVWPDGDMPTPVNSEIVRVTNISTDTLTIARAQETTEGGPAARSIQIGDQIAATITVRTLTDIETAAIGIEQPESVTGAQNNFDLDGPNVVLICSGAAPVFSGFTVNGGAPYAGCKARIICTGTSAKVTNQDTNSTAANRIITPSTAGQIVGVGGIMDLVYDAAASRWREGLLDPGAWLNHAHNAADFTGSVSMTWGVELADLTVFQYRQHGNSLEFGINVNTSTVGGTASTSLRAVVPGGFTLATGTRFATNYAFNGGANLTGYIAFLTGSTFFEFRRLDAANWTLETNTTYVSFQGSCAVQ